MCLIDFGWLVGRSVGWLVGWLIVSFVRSFARFLLACVVASLADGCLVICYSPVSIALVASVW